MANSNIQAVDDTNTQSLPDGGTKDKWIALKCDPNGNLNVNVNTLLSGENELKERLEVASVFDYELIGASETAVVPGGGSGAVGDYLMDVTVKANTGTITILDGAVTFLVIPAATAVGTVYTINKKAKTAWKITTPASTEAICGGIFT